MREQLNMLRSIRSKYEDEVAEYLVCLFAVFVLRFALETVRAVHLSCFMVAAVDEHSFRVQPFNQRSVSYIIMTLQQNLHL